MNRLPIVVLGLNFILLAALTRADTAVKVGYSFSFLRSADVGPPAAALCASDGSKF